MFFRKILRKIKLKIYDQKNIFWKTSEKYSFLASLLVLASITMNFGFDKISLYHISNILILMSSIFYSLVYLFKSILNINILLFLKRNILYTIIITFIFLDTLSVIFNYNILDYSIGNRYLIFLFINLYFVNFMSSVLHLSLFSFYLLEDRVLVDVGSASE